MNYYTMNDVPDEVMMLAEQKFEHEDGWTNFLKQEGVTDSRYVTEAKWKAIGRVLEGLNDWDDEDEDDY